MVAALDTANALLVGAVLYIASALLAARISHPMGHQLSRVENLQRAVARMLREMIDGVRVVVERPAARLPLIGRSVSSGRVT